MPPCPPPQFNPFKVEAMIEFQDGNRILSAPKNTLKGNGVPELRATGAPVGHRPFKSRLGVCQSGQDVTISKCRKSQTNEGKSSCRRLRQRPEADSQSNVDEHNEHTTFVHKVPRLIPYLRLGKDIIFNRRATRSSLFTDLVSEICGQRMFPSSLNH
jgi:hypothetical protein